MATYILVHGAHGGGWYWRKTARILEAAGHAVFTPTLTGTGERVHLVSREIGLETYILDVLNLIKYEDLADIILVGHSLGGLTITGVAGRIPEKLSHLVYFDAYMPENGQSGSDLLGPELSAMTIMAVEAFDGYRLPPAPGADPLLDPQPLKPGLDQVEIMYPEAFDKVPRTFILCTADKDQSNPLFRPIMNAAARVRSHPQWGYLETPHTHEMMMEDPESTAQLLMRIADSTVGS